MSLVLNSSGGGSVTISEPVTASTLTQTLSAATGYLPIVEGSGFLNAGVFTGSLCRAWVNFNGTGTIAIRAAFNVSSITDNGTGDYTLNFSSSMPDANYSVVAFAGTTGSTGNFIMTFANVASPQIAASVRIVSRNNTQVANDLDLNQVAIFR